MTILQYTINVCTCASGLNRMMKIEGIKSEWGGMILEQNDDENVAVKWNRTGEA